MFRLMTESYQFFPVGEPFWYYPRNAEPKDAMIIVAVEDENDYSVDNDSPCKRCEIKDYCMLKENMRNGFYFIPSCSDITRPDDTQVHFELCKDPTKYAKYYGCK